MLLNGHPTICKNGANFIRSYRSFIIERYNMHSSKIAEYLGRNATVVFLLEVDFWQYTRNSTVPKYIMEGAPLTPSYTRTLFDDIAKTIRSNLPNAVISWDISPWLTESEITTYWNYFKTSPYIDYIHLANGVGQGNST